MKKIPVCLFAFVFGLLSLLRAAPVTERVVASAVTGWLNLDATPLDTPLDRDVVDVKRYIDENKETLFFVTEVD